MSTCRQIIPEYRGNVWKSPETVCLCLYCWREQGSWNEHHQQICWKFGNACSQFEYLLNLPLCLWSRKPVTDGRFRSASFHCMVWSKERIGMKSDRVFWPKVVCRLHFKCFIAEKPCLHSSAEGDKVSTKPSKMRQSLMSSGLEKMKGKELYLSV